MLRVSPNDVLAFSKAESNESVLELTSLTNMPITYKIQTTSPEKFRVRPRCGILNPGESISVNILLKPEHTLSEGATKDKFLVMVLPLPQGVNTSEPMTSFWKQIPPNSPNIEEYRLVCAYKSSAEPVQSVCDTVEKPASLCEKIKAKYSKSDVSPQAMLEKQIKYTQILQCISLVFLILIASAVGYMIKKQLDYYDTYTDSIRNSLQKQCTLQKK